MKFRINSLLLPLLFALSGCAGVLQELSELANTAPSARVSGVGFEGIDLESLTLRFDVVVDNPYSFELPLAKFDFGLSTHSQSFLTGNTQLSGNVPARGSKTVGLPIRVDLLGLVRTVQGLRPGQLIPYEAELGLHLDVPGVGPTRLPLNKSGELPIPTIPRIDVSSLDWSEVSLSSVSGILQLDLGNSNEFPFTISSLGYDLNLAGSEVASGSSSESLELTAGGNGRLSIPIAVTPSAVGIALLGVLSGGSADYGLHGMIQLDTPFGPMELPYSSEGVAPLRR